MLRKSLKILAIETATAGCSVALQCNADTLERFEVAPQRHAELILPMIDSLLSAAGIGLKQLDAIAVGQGPGSFMGVRIAAGVAQGLAFGADLPVIPVSTLQTLAQTTYRQFFHQKVIAGWDARMQAIYWGVYSLGDHKLMTAIKSDALNAPSEVQFPEDPKDWFLAGNAWQAYRHQLTPMLTSFPGIVDIYPQAGAMIDIAAVYYQEGKICSPTALEPVYLRDRVTHER